MILTIFDNYDAFIYDCRYHCMPFFLYHIFHFLFLLFLLFLLLSSLIARKDAIEHVKIIKRILVRKNQIILKMQLEQ